MTATETLTSTKPRRRASAKSKKATTKRTTGKRRASPAPVMPPQPVNLPPFRHGMDYQVPNPRTINGRLYKTGEILDKTGLDERHIELLRGQRIIIDIPLGGTPAIPVPDVRPVAPLEPDEKKALAEPDAIVKGRVIAKHRGFGRWYPVDEKGVAIGKGHEGHDARTLAQKECNEINLSNGITPDDEEIALADRTYVGNEG